MNGFRCASIVALGIAFVSAAFSAAAQQTLLRRLERELMVRIEERALNASGFRFGTGELDLRLPIRRGEPQEIFGPTLYARDALAVGSARLEPLEPIMSRDTTLRSARYDLRLEDRRGNCLIVHQDVTFDSALVRGRRTSERCQPLYMAEVIRRARRLARLPLSAGRLDDHWSAALAATGTADVYMDSIVITTSAITVCAAYPNPSTASVVIDSITANLAMGDSTWNTIRTSAAIKVDTTLHQSGEWRRGVRRFTIPIDSTVNLAKTWPVFEVNLSAPKTADNPMGHAWTYAHEKKGFFSKVAGQ